jgi:hypothetical protein
MKKRVTALIPVLLLCFSSTARPDFFGGDLAFLAQLVINSVQQLVQLKNLVSSGKDTLDLMADINQGINDSLHTLKTINPNIDPGIYKDWKTAAEAIRKIQALYGIIVPSKNAGVQRDTDQIVSEAISMNNQIYDYTKQIDAVGEQIKDYSHNVSPGGAEKLTAQTLGIMLHVMNQNLRTQATGLKLQAQALALQNKKEKEETEHTLSTSKDLESVMKNEQFGFSMPRFK